MSRHGAQKPVHLGGQVARVVPARVAQERSTRQKRAISSVLEAGGFRSVRDLSGELRARGENVGLTTLYNQLRTLVQAGELDAMRSDEGETLYRRCTSQDHHHHLVCRRCGHAVEIEGPEVERWASAVADRHGFVDVTHTVEILGTCGACRNEARPGP